MVQELEPNPDSEPKGANPPLAKALHRAFRKTKSPSNASERVSFDEYREIIEDRPEKLNEEQVNYRQAESEAPSCIACKHYFRSKQRSVCEIFRPDPEVDIEADFTCDFQTSDGESYPYLKDEENARTSRTSQNKI